MHAKIKIALVFCLICFFCFCNSIAQENSDSSDASGLDFFGYPYAFYTPETNLAFGVGGIMYFRTSTQKKINLSSILLSGYYTINGQYNISLKPELYFSKNDIISTGEFNFGKYLDKFYGYGSNSEEIENPDYFIQNWEINIDFQYRISDKFGVGFIYDFLFSDIIDKQENPFLIENSVVGSNGGLSSGLGLKFTWDSRNFIHLPTSGGYYIFSVVYYEKPFGSDFSFNDYLLDFRRYFKITKGHIIAVQAFGNFVAGDPPFYEMPRLGGSVTMRGYYEGRYRDRYFATIQGEYKTWLIKKWELGLVIFAGVGDVAYQFSDFVIQNFKYSYGFGFRYIFDTKERLTLRADFAFGKNTSGVYFGIEEAF